jgi:type III pantothenate kinase
MRAAREGAQLRGDGALHIPLRPGAGQVDGLVDRICAELGEVTSVVATGGLAPIVVPESRTITHHEPDLTLIGLRLVFEKNVV